MQSRLAGVVTCTVICFCWNGAVAAASGMVADSPYFQSISNGGNVELLFRSANWKPISECSFKVDAMSTSTDVSVSWTASNIETTWTPKLRNGGVMFQGRYTGRGLMHGECRVMLSNVNEMHLIGVRIVQGLNAYLDFASVEAYGVATVPLEVKPRVQTVTAGSDVTIECLYNSGPLEGCEFMTPKGRIQFDKGHNSKSNVTFQYDGRGLKHGHCGIRLRAVTAKDSGSYYCTVATKGYRGFEVSVLVVSGDETSVEVNVQKNVFDVGEDLVATCRVTGPHPLPETVWLLGNKTLPSEDSRFTELRNAWIWEEQSWTIELNTIVGTQFKELPLRCEQLKNVGCTSKAESSYRSLTKDVKMVSVKPNCGVRIQVEYDSTAKCNSTEEMMNAANIVMDIVDQPTDHRQIRMLKKNFEGYPWHAGIYKFQNDTPSIDGKIHKLFDHICGGTLITTRHVLTAAHCFGNIMYREQNKNNLFKVALGKYFRDYGQFDCRVQWRNFNMKNVHVHPRYVGVQQSHQFDVAVIDLGRPVLLTTRVGLACVDWDLQFSSQLLVNGKIGWLSGWGLTAKDGEPSEVLRTLPLPYMDSVSCLKHLPDKQRYRLSPDKFCAGYRGGNISACKGDSGGGLLFKHGTQGVYYVSGVASTSYRPPRFKGKCYKGDVTSFTALTDYTDWLKEKTFWSNTTYFQTLFYKQPPRREDRKGERKFVRKEYKI